MEEHELTRWKGHKKFDKLEWKLRWLKYFLLKGLFEIFPAEWLWIFMYKGMTEKYI